VTTAWEVRGGLDEGALGQAFRTLGECYPLLRGRFVEERGRTLVRAGGAGTAPLRLSRAGDVAREIDQEAGWFDGPLARLALVRGEGQDVVVMTLPRAVVDGMSNLAVHRRLWSLYTDLCEDRQVDATPVRPVLAAAIDDEVGRRYSRAELDEYLARQREEDARLPWAALPSPAATAQGPGPDRTFGFVRAGAGPAQAAALSELARAHAITLNALLCGLFTVGVRAVLEPAGGPLPIFFAMAVDMRRRMSPPIPDDVLLSAASACPTRFDAVEVTSDPVELGRRIQQSLRDNDSASVSDRELATIPQMLERASPTLAVTNLGRIPPPRLPGHLQATRLHILAMARYPMLMTMITGFDGHLNLDIPFSRSWFEDHQIQAIASRTQQLIDALASGGRHPGG
jgi:NRPS condensation-like uncharacterized protein